jgi:hypothetical protein
MDGTPPEIPPMMDFETFERETERELAGPPRFRIARFGTIKPDSTAQYLVKGLLQSSGLAVVWGAPKCGKSFWVFDLLMHVALGWSYRGHRVTPGPVVYCALEGAQGHKNRIEAFRRGKMSEAADSDPPFYLMSTPLSLVRDHKAFIADISRQLGDQKPAAVCIDTLNRSLEGSESSDEDMSAYVRAADAIRDEFGCLVVIVHHCGHGGDRPRGHSSLMGALDVQIAVRRDAVDNIVAELELSKDGETGMQVVSRLKVVEIGEDQDGDPITSCIIEEVQDGAAKIAASGAKGKRSDDAAKLNRAIAAAYERLASEVEKTAGLDGQPVKKIEIDKLRDEVKSRGFLDTKDTGGVTGAARMLFLRTKTDMIASGRYIENDGLFWKLAARETKTEANRGEF